jgi:hypothetical protein
MDFMFLKNDIQNIFPFIQSIYQDGGKKFYSLDMEISDLRFENGMSGYDYKYTEGSGKVLVGLIFGGTGYSLKRIITINDSSIERHDYFNLNGELTFSSDREALNSTVVDFHEMDLTSPILNHFYNYLSLEYKNAQEGRSQTNLVHSVEILLRKLSQIHPNIAANKGIKDPAIQNYFIKISEKESDQVLTWEERQLVFNNYKKELDIIVSTKIRAHKLKKLPLKSIILKEQFKNFISRLKLRPKSNFEGLFNRYTIGKVVWFFKTVKNNLGYSIALAVYGPFTYYFITMPMNPHAMQAVGKVRTAYLDIKSTLGSVLINSDTVAQRIRTTEVIASTPERSDVVTSTYSAPSKLTIDSINANIIAPSFITSTNNSKAINPHFLNMTLTTDSEVTNNITWSDRMGNFKQMQISYEENIEYASRMGRLEQLETQYNFPMQIEATWEELERYNNLIFKLREENPQLSAKMKQFLLNEINRTQQLELYLWDRMSRFILDQIYVMLDQDKEQKRSDYYIGRSFIFMEEMTNILSWRYKNFKKPIGYDRIEKLSNFYKSNRQEMGTVLKNLSANSDLFKQKDTFDTKEFRSYIKRQWEILYLQNSKAEEASNMGLNMYIWSVRNTAWVLQSLFSAKREEINLLVKKDMTGQLLSPSETLSRTKISVLFETLLHNLTLEYVGVREEIHNHLPKDIESKQRMIVIENLKEFLEDREKLDNLGNIAAKNTAKASL